MSLQFELSNKWTYALVGGLVPAALVVQELWQAAAEITYPGLLLGSILAGYLAKRQGGNATGTGARAGLIAGIPTLWMLRELLVGIVEMPNPAWFSAVGVLMLVYVGAILLLLPMVVGGLGGHVGGWLAEQRGHPRPPAGRRPV